MDTEYQSRSVRLWRAVNSTVIFLGLLLPWLNQSSYFDLSRSTFYWSQLQNVQELKIFPILLLITSLTVALIYPFLNLVAAVSGRTERWKIGLVVTLSLLVFMVLAVPILLAAVIGFQIVPVFSWGYGLILAGLISSTVLEHQLNRRMEKKWRDIDLYYKCLSAACALWLLASIYTSASVYLKFKPESIAFIHGILIDGISSDAVLDSLVLVRDGVIIYAGGMDSRFIEGKYTIIDLDGRTIMPGIINSHVHKGFHPDNLANWLDAGITSVCDLGSPVDYPFFIARELVRPYFHLARPALSGPIITSPGGYPIAEHDLPSLTVNTTVEARIKAKNLISLDVDVVKLALESRYGEPLSYETASEVVTTAHQYGVKSAAHLGNSSDLQRALVCGADSVHHMPQETIPEQTLQMMVDQGVVWVPTMEVMYFFFGDKGIENVSRFIQEGGEIALGNDAGYMPGLQMGMPLREMEQLHKAGLEPMEIIRAATASAAKVCNLEELTGSLASGKSADLIVLDGNPLQYLDALKEVRFVMRSGVIVRNDLD